jgi:putative lysine transport system substrate-binding protein
MKKLIALLLIAAMCLGLAACAAPAAQAPAQTDAAEPTASAEPAVPAETPTASASAAEGPFRIGLECNYAPFNWTQTEQTESSVPIFEGGYADGYDIQVAKIIAEGLGRELEVHKIEWDGLIPALISGKIDAIIAGMSPTEDRKVTIDFSEPYYESDLVVVVMKDGPYAAAQSIQDFSGAKIVGQLNTFHDTVIDQIPDVQHQTPMDTFPAMIVALTSGKVDGYISERPGAISAVASNPELTFVAFEQGKGFEASPGDIAIAVGLPKDSDHSKIDEIISGISEDQRVEMMQTALANQPLSE